MNWTPTQTEPVSSLDIAAALDLEHIGPEVSVVAPASIDDVGPNMISFVRQGVSFSFPLDNWFPLVVVCCETADLPAAVTRLVATNPRHTFAQVLQRWFVQAPRPGVSPNASVAKGATVGQRVSIAPFAVVSEGVCLGDDCAVGAGTYLGPGTKVASNVKLGQNSVIGSIGYGFEKGNDDVPIRIPHLGGVRIESGVEIGSCVTIARGTLGDTTIGCDTKIDDHVFVAHNAQVGARVMLIAHAEVSGSVTIGDDAWIAPNATVIQKVTIGARATVGIGAVVIRDVPAGAVVVGNPAKSLDRTQH